MSLGTLEFKMKILKTRGGCLCSCAGRGFLSSLETSGRIQVEMAREQIASPVVRERVER